MEIDVVLSTLRHFVSERDWEKFHSSENLAKSIAIESGELLECFQWGVAASREAQMSELADILTYCYLLADKLNVNPHELVLSKLTETAEKYPVSKAKGRSTKYDRL